MGKLIQLTIMGILMGVLVTLKYSGDKDMENCIKWGCIFGTVIIIIHEVLMYTF